MKHKHEYNGSPRQLLILASPLIITWISTTMMMFVDRFLLSQYSLEALGAAVNAGTIAWGFTYGFQVFTEMAQVIVAQHRGAGQEGKMIQPVWQMIWLVLLSFIFFLPLALLGSRLFFSVGSLQGIYFRWLVISGPAFGLIGASSAYFIGKGEGRIVTLSAIIGNVVNLALDCLLIFGLDGFMEPMGIKGAAIGTGIGMLTQGLILLALFLHRTQKVVFPLCWSELKPCLRVGVPPGLFIGCELIGWGVFYSMMASASSEHLLVTSICQSLLPLFASVGIGLQKATASIGGNLIGARKLEEIPRLIRSGLILLVTYMGILALSTYFLSDHLIDLFAKLNSGSQEIRFDGCFRETLKTGLFLSCGYLLFGGVRCVLAGLLSAAGDTWFLSTAGTLSVWLLLIVPTYFVVQVGQASVTAAQMVLASYGFSQAIIYWLRFRSGRWVKNCLLIKSE
jgi:MATE family multidrug resistance protein